MTVTREDMYKLTKAISSQADVLKDLCEVISMMSKNLEILNNFIAQDNAVSEGAMQEIRTDRYKDV